MRDTELQRALNALCDSYELEIFSLNEVLHAVRDLHQPFPWNSYGDHIIMYCKGCSDKKRKVLYPCETAKLLGEEEGHVDEEL